MVDTTHKLLSVNAQCRLLGIHRSGLYYKPREESALNLHLMKIIDREIFDKPFYGTRRMTAHLNIHGYKVNRKRVERLYRLMGIKVQYPKKNLSKAAKGHKKYPYLLRGLEIKRPNQVWAADITWIPMKRGFMYMMAIIDLYSRKAINWSISNAMDAQWCSDVLQEAIEEYGTPEIFNTDQGSQFTSITFTSVLKKNEIRISMDGKGRATDNAFVERLFRSVKQEYVYIEPANGGLELYKGLKKYIDFYNNERPHQALDYKRPNEIYQTIKKVA